MTFIADLHVHSKYSRATSRDLDLEHLHQWAQLKGVDVVGTGDCLHPAWLKELREKLVPAEEGLWRLRDDLAREVDRLIPSACRRPVRFMLTVEISNIYKKNGRVRKVHNCVFLPDFHTLERLRSRLETIGNLSADGRPILGLDSKDLFAMVLESGPLSFFIPAHIWTPWFSVLGSKSGFDSLEECFEDLTPHLFAVETGLSSDPPMNWRLSQLDGCVLVSNSDAHSPAKLGREATVFEAELSFPGIRRALEDRERPGVAATIEFFPEEGKYHYDGHRACGVRFTPQQTRRHDGCCPQCGRPVTVGVLSRVEELADHPAGRRAPHARPFYSLIPLAEIIADVRGCGVQTKSVRAQFFRMLGQLGPELVILLETPLIDIERRYGEALKRAIANVREGKVSIQAGYDGEYGRISVSDGPPDGVPTEQVTLFSN